MFCWAHSLRSWPCHVSCPALKARASHKDSRSARASVQTKVEMEWKRHIPSPGTSTGPYISASRRKHGSVAIAMATAFEKRTPCRQTALGAFVAASGTLDGEARNIGKLMATARSFDELPQIVDTGGFDGSKPGGLCFLRGFVIDCGRVTRILFRMLLSNVLSFLPALGAIIAVFRFAPHRKITPGTIPPHRQIRFRLRLIDQVMFNMHLSTGNFRGRFGHSCQHMLTPSGWMTIISIIHVEEIMVFVRVFDVVFSKRHTCAYVARGKWHWRYLLMRKRVCQLHRGAWKMAPQQKRC